MRGGSTEAYQLRDVMLLRVAASACAVLARSLAHAHAMLASPAQGLRALQNI